MMPAHCPHEVCDCHSCGALVPIGVGVFTHKLRVENTLGVRILEIQPIATLLPVQLTRYR